MNNLDSRTIKELFSRIFVLGVQNKINLHAFTKALERSEFVNKIELNQYDDYFNKPLEDIFFDITNMRIDKDESYGIYNDAYWCGYSYFEIHQRTKKSFAFIFLKLPLYKMMDLYPVYHEMDISSLLEYFHKLDKEQTILRLLCKEKKCSISKLSLVTGLNIATLKKYNASDECLYKGSFEAIYKIATYYSVPMSLFVSHR